VDIPYDALAKMIDQGKISEEDAFDPRKRGEVVAKILEDWAK